MKTVVVTGAAGFIGRNLTKELLNKGYFVIAIDNLSKGKIENIEEFFKNKNFTFAKTDIKDVDEVLNIFKTYVPDTVFHLAANAELQYSIDRPIETNNVNVNGTLNILEVSKKTNVKRLIFASSSGVYGDVNVDDISEYEEKKPISPYTAQKLIGEIYCKLYFDLYGLETISLRLFNVYGPWQNSEGSYAALIPKTIRRCLDYESPEIYGDGFKTRDFIYVDDVIKAFIKAGTTENKDCLGESFNVGKGISTTVNIIIDEILVQTDRTNLNIKKLPSVIEPEYIKADIDKAIRVLGWKPAIDISTGIKRTVKYFEDE